MRLVGLVALLAAVPLVACRTTTSPLEVAPEDSGSPDGGPCAVTTDCAPGLLCGYAEDGGCSATGVCVGEDLSCMQDGPTVCACDGTPVGLACIYGPGYAPAPIRSTTPGCEPDLDAAFFD